MHRPLLLTVTLLSLTRAASAQSLSDLPPDALNDGWETASPSTQNLDPAHLHALLEQIRTGPYKTLRSLLLVKNGKLVLEEYFPRQQERHLPPRRHCQSTSTSSPTSIKSSPPSSPNTPTSSPPILPPPPRPPLHVRRPLLDEWIRPYTDPLNDHVRMLAAPTPSATSSNAPSSPPPALALFHTSTLLSVLLGHKLFQEKNILERLTGSLIMIAGALLIHFSK